MHTVEKWTRPSNYVGATWHGYYSAGFGQSRDSSVTEASNFQFVQNALEALNTFVNEGSRDEEPTVVIVNESHWAVGWVQWIAIHESNVAALDKARELCERANNYPLLDEEDVSRREDEECEQVWRECFNPSERVRYFRRHSYTATNFSDLLQAIRGGSWGHAANMLHSPSDLLY